MKPILKRKAELEDIIKTVYESGFEGSVPQREAVNGACKLIEKLYKKGAHGNKLNLSR